MILTETIDERVEDMCNFSEGIWEDGKAEGRAEMVRNLMRNLSLSIERAMEVLGIPEEEREDCQRLVAAMA